MAILKAAILARAPNAGLAAVGVFWGAFAALVPDIKAEIAAPDAAFGLAMMMAALGGIAAMALAPRLIGPARPVRPAGRGRGAGGRLLLPASRP